MNREQMDEISRIALTRAIAACGEICEEFKHRHPEDEPLIETIRLRQREALTMLIPTPDVRTSGR